MKKTIIHIALGKANPERQNGVNKVVNSVATYQIKNNLNVEFWGITHNPTHNYPSRNYSTRLFNDYRNKFKIDPQLKNALRTLNPQEVIIHIHGAFIPQFYTISKLLKKLSIPYFFTPHGGYNLKALERSKWTKKVYIKLFERFLVNSAIGVQLLGESEKEGANKFFNNTFHFIPNGQELQKKHFKQPAIRHNIQIGFLGRIDIETKGLDILLEGIAIVSKHITIQLDIVGSGGEIEQLKKRVKHLQLTKQVSFKGALFGEEKLNLIAKWDALCLTSRNEGLPGVVLEAASVGTPSIVSKATNMVHYIQYYNSGWILPQNNGFFLSEMLHELHHLKRTNQLTEFKESAQTMISNTFDWNKIVKQLIVAYA